MGCDIHTIAEVKENGVWKRNTDIIFKNPYFDETEKNKPKKEQWDFVLNEFSSNPPSSSNYDWFAILADVRNGIGFAGISTGEGFSVIAEPKGLPDDISEEGLKFFCYGITDDEELMDEETLNERGEYVYYVSRDTANKWVNDYGSKMITIDGENFVTNCDYHSDSYLTVEDFDNFDWNQLTMKYGVVPLEQYKDLRLLNKSPKEWCGAISGGNIVTISEDEADKILDGNTELMLTRHDRFSRVEPETKPASEWDVEVGYQWSVLYSEAFEHNINGTVEPLRKLSEKYEDARIVFSFDN